MTFVLHRFYTYIFLVTIIKIFILYCVALYCIVLYCTCKLCMYPMCVLSRLQFSPFSFVTLTWFLDLLLSVESNRNILLWDPLLVEITRKNIFCCLYTMLLVNYFLHITCFNMWAVHKQVSHCYRTQNSELRHSLIWTIMFTITFRLSKNI